MTVTNSIGAQQLDFSKVKSFEHQLDDVMEIIDTTELKLKLKEVEEQFQKNSNEMSKIRLGIIYHETALNLTFFSKTEYKGYAQKSYDILTELSETSSISPELLPFISSYRASTLSLVSAETKKLRLLNDAFDLFEKAVNQYSNVSYIPEFLRGSVAENLPWIFVSKRKFAKKDFQSIINKQLQHKDFANWKIMSFTYWAWANQHKNKKFRNQSIVYLEKAIQLDPDYKAGRKKAEELKSKLTN